MMMTADISYKLPKKMKKRRQLDALVDTVKLPRSRKNSTSAQELLDYHSDSSEVEEYSAPVSRVRKKCCFCHSVVARIGLFMVSMACLTTCIGLVWVQWHIRHELDILRKDIHTVQNTDTTPPEFLQFKAQLVAINGTINNLKAESLLTITKDITTVKDELRKLKDETSKLTKSVDAASDIFDLPNKLDTLQNTVATATNDLEGLKGKVDKLMTPKTTLAPHVDTTSLKPDLSDKFAVMITEEFDHLNSSVEAKILAFNQLLEKQQNKITMLEASAVFNSTGLSVMIHGIVHDMIANHSLESPGNTSLKMSEDKLDALRDEVTKIVDDVKKIMSQKISTGDFYALREDTMASLGVINSTILTLHGELNTVNNRINLIGQNVNKLTEIILAQNTTTADINNKDSISTPTQAPTQAPTQSSSVRSSDRNTTALSKEPTLAPVLPTLAPVLPTSAPVLNNVTEGKETLTISGVNSIEDLESKMLGWPLQEEKVNITTLNTILETKLDPGKMKPFDLDNDDLFTEEEMASALGLEKGSS